MLNNREKRVLLITSIVSLALSLVICVPFTLAKLSKAELIIKYIVIPAVIAVISIVNYSIKYRNYRPAYRFPVLSSYIPLFSCVIAIAVNTVLLLGRTSQGFTLVAWIAIMAVAILYLISVVALIHVFYKALIVFSKNEIILIDSLLIAVLVIDAIAFGIIANRLVGLSEPFTNPSWLFVFMPILLGGLVVAFHIMYLLKVYKTDAEYQLESKQELIARYKALHKSEYEKARVEILESLYYFSHQNTDFASNEYDDGAMRKQIQILEKEISRLNKELEEFNKNPQPTDVLVIAETEKQIKELEERVAELEAEKAAAVEKTRQEAEERAKEEAERAAEEARLEALKVAEEERALIEAEAEKAVDDAEKARTEAEKAAEEAEKAKAEAEAERRAKEEAEKAAEEEKARMAEEAEKARTEAEKAAEEAEKAKAEADALKAAEEERLAALKAAEAERARLAAERAAAAAKLKRAIKPSYEKLVKYASTIDREEDITVLSNEKETQHKFYYQKKLFLVMNNSNVDYRVSFLKFKEQAIDLIIEYPGVVLKAKSPKGENWYRLINKGELEEKFLKTTIKESLDVLKKIELEKKARKEREKAEKAANRKAVRLNKKAIERLSEKENA